MISRFSRLALAFAVLAAALLPSSAFSEEKPLVIFAAASLKNALDHAATDWTKATGHQVSVSYAGSSALAKQIDQGAPADIFISADIPWMDDVDGKGLVAKGTRLNLLGNRLVLVAAPGYDGKPVDITQGFPLGRMLGDGRLAMADVEAVPAGRYGKAALTSLGVWADVEPKLAQAENVRAALALVARGEAPFGIVYATDARAEPEVKVIGAFPAGSHPAIIYPAAVLSSSSHEQARAFLDYLGGGEARTRFEDEGFTVLAKDEAS
ncbi:molybdate ABC transporter substrate-binding protein [Agaricicola taiwanensis]|uniref:Molybdate ABC transporter substrate-binding protein n=1 Tax=Agaricicola taiwanensis TaxID=591372 RepID=A0A8J2YMP8_9RHOB|nr:molybdate ABC transporter substrate-binding protein [Agaricicola taiwanensis]GGE53497.1 molybdate ABC transporter substrate-binding protein [Agaricicola taiwanensis]